MDNIHTIINDMKTDLSTHDSISSIIVKNYIKRIEDLISSPDAYMLKTGHGTKIVEEKPPCEVDYWKPLYRMEK